MTINIPTPFGEKDKSFSFETKQQTLHAEPSERQKEAVWMFLQSQENFQEDWKENYTNWLDLIKKRKPQQTFWNGRISPVDLTPLWDVDSKSNYSNLNSQAKQTLSKLSQLSYEGNSSRNYKIIIFFTFRFFSFDKETNSAVYKLIKILTSNDRWTNLKKYQINKISDVDIKPLLNVQNVASLSDNKETYDDFSDSVKASLRNLLDLDVNSSNMFEYDFIQFFSNENNYNSILAAFERRIDNVISDITTEAPDLWNFLKQSNRLQDIKTRLIPYIGDVDVSPLHSVEPTTLYDNLSNTAKGTLFDLLQIPNYDENTIDTFIQNDKDTQPVWTFLQSSNNFENDWSTATYSSWLDLIKKRKPQKTTRDGKASAVVNLIPLWDVNAALLYKDLTPEIKKNLWELKQLSHSDNNAWNYTNIIKFTLQYFSFGKETNSAVYNLITTLKTNNRWADLRQYEIKMIQDVDIQSLLALTSQKIIDLIGNKDAYDGLEDSVQITLRNLLDLDLSASSQFADVTQIFASSTNYNPILAALATRIDNIIIQAKIDETNTALWNFLKQSDRLQDIKTRLIPYIATVDVSSLHGVAVETTYGNLNTFVKTELRSLSQISDHRDQIDLDIANDKANKTIWTFLTSENRLTNLQQYHINKIDEMLLLPFFQSVTPTTEYKTLNLLQRMTLKTLGQIPDYQKKINDRIKKDKDSETVFNFLTTSNRLANLEQYQLQTIDTVELLPILSNAEIKKRYTDETSLEMKRWWARTMKTTKIYTVLSQEQKTTLYTFFQRTNYQNEIDNAISAAQTAASNAWTFLTTDDRLANLKKYKIKTINDVALLPLFENVPLTTEYESLSNAEKTKLNTLRKITNYQDIINDLITKEKNLETVWIFLTNENRFASLKKYEIKIINGITLLPLFEDVALTTAYKDLTNVQKTRLNTLSKTTNYKNIINDLIGKEKNLETAWIFLTTDDRLANLKKYEIKIINEVTLLPFFANVPLTTKYESLSNGAKTKLNTLRKTTNYQTKINDLINKEKKAETAWTFLKTSNRLKNLKQYNVKKIEKVTLLPLFKNVALTTEYKDLTNAQKTTLNTLSKITNYQDVVKKTIIKVSKPNTEDSADLLWLWITLPSVLTFLIVGLVFYLYRFKILSIFKSKKLKE